MNSSRAIAVVGESLFESHLISSIQYSTRLSQLFWQGLRATIMQRHEALQLRVARRADVRGENTLVANADVAPHGVRAQEGRDQRGGTCDPIREPELAGVVGVDVYARRDGDRDLVLGCDGGFHAGISCQFGTGRGRV